MNDEDEAPGYRLTRRGLGGVLLFLAFACYALSYDPLLLFVSTRAHAHEPLL